MSSLQAQQVIEDRYRLTHPLGQGGMGTTWEAEDLSNGQRVALKALSVRAMTNWKSLELFQRESRVLENLDHPGVPDFVASLHDEDAEQGGFFLVQELIEGPTLSTRVKQGWHPDEPQVLALAETLLETLVYLHGRSPALIHRDIKPANIILRQEDSRPVLVDFGAVQDSVRGEHSIASTVVGTYGYMAPEQFRGKATAQSDLYALGATLMFALTRRAPEELPQTRLKIDIKAVTALSPGFTRWLETLLEPFPEDRFLNAAQALDALRNLDREPPVELPTLGPAPENVKDNSEGHVLDLTLRSTPWRQLSAMQWLIRSMAGIGLFAVVAFLMWMILTNLHILPLIFLFSTMCLFGIWTAARHWLESQRVVMDRTKDSFRLERSIMGITWRTQHGKLSDVLAIRMAEPTWHDKRQRKPSPYVRIATKDTEFTLGLQLSLQEQHWASVRLGDYLKDTKTNPPPMRFTLPEAQQTQATEVAQEVTVSQEK